MTYQISKIVKIIFAFCLVILIFAFCFLNLHEACAQQITLSISPPLLEVLIKPGKSIVVAYTLKNLGDPTIMKIKVLPFVPKDERGNTLIKRDFEGPIKFALDNSYIKLDQSFFLKTQESQQLVLRIRVPEGAPEQDYYYTILAETQPAPAEEGKTSSTARATLGSNILLIVTSTGKVEVNGIIDTFDFLSRYQFSIFGKNFRIIDSNDQILVTEIIENRGKNLIKPQGVIMLQGGIGEKQSHSIIPQNILGRSKRLVITNEVSGSRELVSTTFTGFFLGRYVLSTNVNFAEGSQTLLASTSFIALPFKFIIGISIALVFSSIILKKIRKKEPTS